MKRLLPLLLLFALATQAKDAPTTIIWPDSEHPVVRFTFGKFVKGGSMGSLSSYNVDVIAENLWSKPIPEATFDAFFFAKDNTRIGNGYISLNHMGAGEKVRFTVSFSVTGAQPVSPQDRGHPRPEGTLATGAAKEDPVDRLFGSIGS